MRQSADGCAQKCGPEGKRLQEEPPSLLRSQSCSEPLSVRAFCAMILGETLLLSSSRHSANVVRCTNARGGREVHQGSMVREMVMDTGYRLKPWKEQRVPTWSRSLSINPGHEVGREPRGHPNTSASGGGRGRADSHESTGSLRCCSADTPADRRLHRDRFTATRKQDADTRHMK